MAYTNVDVGGICRSDVYLFQSEFSAAKKLGKKPLHIQYSKLGNERRKPAPFGCRIIRSVPM